MLIGRFVIVLAVELLALTAAVIWMIRSPGTAATTVVTIVSLSAVFVLAATAFHMLWRPMLASFPAREPAPDAVRRRYQSFGVGIVNMALSVHVAADDDYLHLVPLPILQWLGARPASIPWSAMEPVGRSGRVVRVNGVRIDGPQWCMVLAGSGESREDG